MDATKAFDRVHHAKLFQKLIYKGLGLPGGIINILVDWYGKTSSIVKWNNSYSSSYSINSGIRQGAILSPFLFNIYFDSIIVALKQAGCHMGGVYIGCLAYADDLILISASVVKLQKMLHGYLFHPRHKP